MPIKLGETAASLSSAITKVMLGDALVWQPASGPVNYTLTELSSLEHDTTNGTYNSICKIDDTHFVVAYQGSTAHGFIKTFVVNADKSVTEIDSLEHEGTSCSHCSLSAIDSQHFVLAYSGVDGDGFIKTFSCDSGFDNITQIDSLEHDTDRGEHNSLVIIDATHFILAYNGELSDGKIKTFSTDANCDNIAEIDSIEHTLGAPSTYNSLVKIDDTHYILACTGDGNDGFIHTFSISASYAITSLKKLEHDTSYGLFSSLAAIDATHFALAYRANTYVETVKTFSIDGSYNISAIDSLVLDSADGTYNSLVKIDNTHFLLAYCGIDGDGFIKTFSLDESYQITEIDSLEHDISKGEHNAICMIDATHYALVYAGVDDDGFVKIFEID